LAYSLTLLCRLWLRCSRMGPSHDCGVGGDDRDGDVSVVVLTGALLLRTGVEIAISALCAGGVVGGFVKSVSLCSERVRKL